MRLWARLWPPARDKERIEEAERGAREGEDNRVSELLANAEGMRARVLRRIAAKKESPRLHKLADEAEAQAELYRAMGLEAEEFDALIAAEARDEEAP